MAALPSFSSMAKAASSFPSRTIVNRTFAQLQALADGDVTLRDFYVTTDPLGISLLTSIFLSVVTFTLAEVTGNYSQVDRLWSILPAIYVCHYSFWGHLNEIYSDRLDTAALIVFLWSLRLTYNYWRKGGYQWSVEDYRWEIIRLRIGRFGALLLNATFISFIQNFLLLAITTPAYLFLVLAKNFPDEGSTNSIDTVFSRGMMLTIIFEYFSDQQQWSMASFPWSGAEVSKPVLTILSQIITKPRKPIRPVVYRPKAGIRRSWIADLCIPGSGRFLG